MKPGVFTQLYVQLVFATKNRECLLKNENHKEELFKYISGILTSLKQKSIIINGVSDHIHILFGLHHTMSISDIVKEIKRSSSLLINSKKWFAGKFSWQEGYGAFSYSRSDLDRVYKYIENQALHHKERSFREEYIELLKKFDIEYNSNYLFMFFK